MVLQLMDCSLVLVGHDFVTLFGGQLGNSGEWRDLQAQPLQGESRAAWCHIQQVLDGSNKCTAGHG